MSVALSKMSPLEPKGVRLTPVGEVARSGVIVSRGASIVASPSTVSPRPAWVIVAGFQNIDEMEAPPAATPAKEVPWKYGLCRSAKPAGSACDLPGLNAIAPNDVMAASMILLDLRIALPLPAPQPRCRGI